MGEAIDPLDLDLVPLPEGRKKRYKKLNEDEKAADAKLTDEYFDTITGQTNGVTGVMRVRARKCFAKKGKRNRPYCHQRIVAKRGAADECRRLIVCHDPGTGKTFSFMLMLATRHVLDAGKRMQVMVSAPKGLLRQWKNSFLDSLRIPEERIHIVTNAKDMTTKADFEKYDVLLVSRNLLGTIYEKSHQWVKQHHQNERGAWISAWDRIPGTEEHLLLTHKFDFFGQDEVQYLRNERTAWTQSHMRVAKNSTRVIALSATPLMGKVDDLHGIANAMDLSPEFKDISNWYTDGTKRTKINVALLQRFMNDYLDRFDADNLDLPPLREFVMRANPAMVPGDEVDYNKVVQEARTLKMFIQRNGSATAEQYTKLLGYLTYLKQYLVGPTLARTGVKNATAETYEQAAREPTGLKDTLGKCIQRLNSEGHYRILVCCAHPSMLRVAKLFLDAEVKGIGQTMIYDGTLTDAQREIVKYDFLNNERTVMMLSIDAGGCGLDLVPGSNAVVFWGSQPFSPMDIKQAKHRVHRIGQTEEVKVVHIIAEGSVDAAIKVLHKGKKLLADAVLSMDTRELAARGGKWREAGRIIDECKFLNGEGQFHMNSKTEKQMLQELANAHLPQMSELPPLPPPAIDAVQPLPNQLAINLPFPVPQGVLAHPDMQL